MPSKRSTEWSFNFRTCPVDSDDSDDSDATLLNQASNETRLIEDFDLSSRKETVQYKPNPFSIAKINAALRKKADDSSRNNFSGSTPQPPLRENSRTKQKQPTNQIADYFKKQAQRSSSDIPGIPLRPKPIARKDFGIGAASQRSEYNPVRPQTLVESNLGSTFPNVHRSASLLPESESDSCSVYVNQATPFPGPALSRGEEPRIVLPTSLPSTVPASGDSNRNSFSGPTPQPPLRENSRTKQKQPTNQIAEYFKKQAQKPSSDLSGVPSRPKPITRKDSGVDAASKRSEYNPVRPQILVELNPGSAFQNVHRGASLLSESDSGSVYVNKTAPFVGPVLSRDEEAHIVHPTSLLSTVPASSSELEDESCEDQLPPSSYNQSRFPMATSLAQNAVFAPKLVQLPTPATISSRPGFPFSFTKSSGPFATSLTQSAASASKPVQLQTFVSPIPSRAGFQPSFTKSSGPFPTLLTQSAVSASKPQLPTSVSPIPSHAGFPFLFAKPSGPVAISPTQSAVPASKPVQLPTSVSPIPSRAGFPSSFTKASGPFLSSPFSHSLPMSESAHTSTGVRPHDAHLFFKSPVPQLPMSSPISQIPKNGKYAYSDDVLITRASSSPIRPSHNSAPRYFPGNAQEWLMEVSGEAAAIYARPASASNPAVTNSQGSMRLNILIILLTMAPPQ